MTARLEHFVAPGPVSHVFTGALGGQFRRSNFHEVWERDRKKAKISEEVHFHDLRQTGNTPASNAGASTRELMTRMGHSSTRAVDLSAHDRRPGSRHRGQAGADDQRSHGGRSAAPK
nr:tyrosine-type recombinase/integrase [Streptacidiphilus anmyonensis]